MIVSNNNQLEAQIEAHDRRMRESGPSNAHIPVRVAITEKAFALISLYIEECPIECSMLGITRIEGEGRNKRIVIHDVAFLPQQNTAANTELDPMALADWMEDEKNEDLLPHARVWIHSHVNFNVFWSPTDIATIEEAFCHGEWMLHLVGNKKGEFLLRFDMYKPFRVTMDGIPFEVLYEVNKEPFRATVKDNLQKFSKAKPVSTPVGNYSGNAWSPTTPSAGAYSGGSGRSYAQATVTEYAWAGFKWGDPPAHLQVPSTVAEGSQAGEQGSSETTVSVEAATEATPQGEVVETTVVVVGEATPESAPAEEDVVVNVA